MTDKLDAKLEQAKGTVKEAFGKLTDDKKIEAEGVVDKVAGKAIEGVKEGIKNQTEDDQTVE